MSRRQVRDELCGGCVNHAGDDKRVSMAPVRFGALQGIAGKEYFSGELKDILQDPDGLFERPGAKIFKQMGNTRTLRFSAAGEEFFLKHYLGRTWALSLLGFFRGSRGRKAMNKAALFESRSVPTPEPVALLEKKRFFCPVESYLLFKYHKEMETLSQMARRMGQERFLNTGLLGLTGSDVFQMHSAGLYHGDLKWSNVLVSEKGRGIGMLVDLDGAGMLGFRKKDRAAMDLSRFLVDLFEIMTERITAAEIFLMGYFEAAGGSREKKARLLGLVEKKVSRKLMNHSRARGHSIRIEPGEITGLLDRLT